MASLTLLTRPLALPATERWRTGQGGQQGYSDQGYLRGLMLGCRRYAPAGPCGWQTYFLGTGTFSLALAAGFF